MSPPRGVEWAGGSPEFLRLPNPRTALTEHFHLHLGAGACHRAMSNKGDITTDMIILFSIHGNILHMASVAVH